MSKSQGPSSTPGEQVLDRIVAMVEEIVRPMLAFPDELRSETSTLDELTIYRLSVAPEDLSKITGREGRIAESLKSVVTALSVKHSREIFLEIVATR